MLSLEFRARAAVLLNRCRLLLPSSKLTRWLWNPGSELLPDATPAPTEEEEFLANVSGDANGFSVRLYFLISQALIWLRQPNLTDITNPTSTSARQIVKSLAGL